MVHSGRVDAHVSLVAAPVMVNHMVRSERVDAYVPLVAAPVMINQMVHAYPLPGAKRLKEEARPAARLFGRVIAEAAIHFRARGLKTTKIDSSHLVNCI